VKNKMLINPVFETEYRAMAHTDANFIVVKATKKAQYKSFKGIPKETEENHDYLVLEANFVHEEVCNPCSSRVSIFSSLYIGVVELVVPFFVFLLFFYFLLGF